MEIIVERRYVSVMSADEFAEVYNDGFDFPGYYCQACQAWHDWNGQVGPFSPCLSETELRQVKLIDKPTTRAIPREILSLHDTT